LKTFLTRTGCGHTKGKSVVSREEAFARIRAACDARDEGQDIFILARTDALVVGWEEAMARAAEFKRLGVDAIFVEALPDRAAMRRCVEEVDMPMLANIIEGGKTENLSAKELAELGFSAVAYPWTLVAAKLKSIRDTLESLKRSLTVGPPEMILSYDEVVEGVGFKKYWVRSSADLPFRIQLMCFLLGTGREIQVFGVIDLSEYLIMVNNSQCYSIEVDALQKHKRTSMLHLHNHNANDVILK
jgi:hypothetical protein